MDELFAVGKVRSTIKERQKIKSQGTKVIESSNIIFYTFTKLQYVNAEK